MRRALAAAFACAWAQACTATRTNSVGEARLDALAPTTQTPTTQTPTNSTQDQPPAAVEGQPAATTASPALEAPAAEKLADSSLAIHGDLQARYVGRKSGDAHDQDVYAVAAVDVGDAARDPITAHFVGRVYADIDGQHDADSQPFFHSLADTYDNPIHGQLYEAYVDVQQPAGLGAMRIGRQIDYLTPTFAYFDGVAVTSKTSSTMGLVGGLYGGVPVHQYESSPAGDSMLGAWGESRPWTNGRVRLDWMHVRDDNHAGDFDNDLFGASVWQNVGQETLLDATYTRLEQRNRDLRLRATWDDKEHDFYVQLRYYRLLETQKQLATEFDPYFDSLQSYFPFAQYGLQLSKGLTEKLRVDGGLDLRNVIDNSDEGTFNHDYTRGYASLVVLDCLVSELTLTLTGDWWDSDDQDISSWGFDLTKQFNDKLRASLGTNYALYKYDVFTGRERDDVRVWYLQMHRAIAMEWTFDLGYDYEDDDQDEYHVLTAGATWKF